MPNEGESSSSSVQPTRRRMLMGTPQSRPTGQKRPYEAEDVDNSISYKMQKYVPATTVGKVTYPADEVKDAMRGELAFTPGLKPLLGRIVFGMMRVKEQVGRSLCNNSVYAKTKSALKAGQWSLVDLERYLSAEPYIRTDNWTASALQSWFELVLVAGLEKEFRDAYWSLNQASHAVLIAKLSKLVTKPSIRNEPQLTDIFFEEGRDIVSRSVYVEGMDHPIIRSAIAIMMVAEHCEFKDKEASQEKINRTTQIWAAWCLVRRYDGIETSFFASTVLTRTYKNDLIKKCFSAANDELRRWASKLTEDSDMDKLKRWQRMYWKCHVIPTSELKSRPVALQSLESHKGPNSNVTSSTSSLTGPAKRKAIASEGPQKPSVAPSPTTSSSTVPASLASASAGSVSKSNTVAPPALASITCAPVPSTFSSSSSSTATANIRQPTNSSPESSDKKEKGPVVTPETSDTHQERTNTPVEPPCPVQEMIPRPSGHSLSGQPTSALTPSDWSSLISLMMNLRNDPASREGPMDEDTVTRQVDNKVKPLREDVMDLSKKVGQSMKVWQEITEHQTAQDENIARRLKEQDDSMNWRLKEQQDVIRKQGEEIRRQQKSNEWSQRQLRDLNTKIQDQAIKIDAQDDAVQSVWREINSLKEKSGPQRNGSAHSYRWSPLGKPSNRRSFNNRSESSGHRMDQMSESLDGAPTGPSHHTNEARHNAPTRPSHGRNMSTDHTPFTPRKNRTDDNY